MLFACFAFNAGGAPCVAEEGNDAGSPRSLLDLDMDGQLHEYLDMMLQDEKDESGQGKKALKPVDRSYTVFRYQHSKLFTADPYPVAPGHVQVKTSYFFVTADRAFGPPPGFQPLVPYTEHVGRLAVEAGVARNLDLGVTAGTGVLDTPRLSPADTTMHFYSLFSIWQLWSSQDNQAAIAYTPTFFYVFGRRDNPLLFSPSKNDYAFDNRITLNKDIGALNLTNNLDIGFITIFGDQAPCLTGIFTANLASGYQIGNWLQPEIEIGYFHESIPGLPVTDALLLSGGVLVFYKNFRLEIGGAQVVVGSNIDNVTIGLVSLAYTF